MTSVQSLVNNRLRTLGVLPKSVSWLSSFLADRTMAVRVGSCFSSQLLNIPSLPEFPKVPTWDRFCFWFLSMTYQTTLTSSLTFTLKIHCQAPPHYLPRGAFQTAAQRWVLQWHGRFGHANTKQFNIGNTQSLFLATVIEGHQIEGVRHKHLGITFTPDPKWNAHIQEVIGNAAKRAGLLRWISHHLRGPLIAHLYLAFVHSTMEYASRVV